MSQFEYVYRVCMRNIFAGLRVTILVRASLFVTHLHDATNGIVKGGGGGGVFTCNLYPGNKAGHHSLYPAIECGLRSFCFLVGGGSILHDFSLNVKVATLIFISGCCSAISSDKQGKPGSIYNLVRINSLFGPRKRACISCKS